MLGAVAPVGLRLAGSAVPALAAGLGLTMGVPAAVSNIRGRQTGFNNPTASGIPGSLMAGTYGFGSGGLLGGGKDGALATISKVVDELHTSEEEKLDKKILMQRLQQKLAEKQLDVNAKEASHRSVFVAGWRPAIGWCGAMALFFAFILSPCIEWYAKFSGIDIVPPAIETGPLLAIVTSMLGVAGMRSFEKAKGIAK